MKPFVNFKIAEDGYSGIVCLGDDTLFKTEFELMAEDAVEFINKRHRASVREELMALKNKLIYDSRVGGIVDLNAIDIDAFMDREETK